MKFGHLLSASFDDRRHRGIRFVKSTFLNGNVLLIFRQVAEAFPDR